MLALTFDDINFERNHAHIKKLYKN